MYNRHFTFAIVSALCFVVPLVMITTTISKWLLNGFKSDAEHFEMAVNERQRNVK